MLAARLGLGHGDVVAVRQPEERKTVRRGGGSNKEATRSFDVYWIVSLDKLVREPPFRKGCGSVVVSALLQAPDIQAATRAIREAL